jgi:hypothetical protein
MTTLLERLGHLEAAIVATPARTMEGFFVKARAASWALLGDLDPAGAKTIDQRMALSIIRDLIQLYDPRLESAPARSHNLPRVTDEPQAERLLRITVLTGQL